LLLLRSSRIVASSRDVLALRVLERPAIVWTPFPPGYRIYYALVGRGHHETKSPEFAAECLRAALEDIDEPRVLLIALRRIAKARGGIAKVAKAAGIERESLYRALSAHGNPRLSTLGAVTKAVGLKLTVGALSDTCLSGNLKAGLHKKAK
jgi:probable addiction module antidote protein